MKNQPLKWVLVIIFVVAIASIILVMTPPTDQGDEIDTEHSENNPITNTELNEYLFDGKDVKVGDQIAGMEVVSVDANDPQDTDTQTFSFHGEFSGKKTISGKFIQNEEDALLNDLLIFIVDDAMEHQLPKLENDDRYVWFAFKNNEEAIKMYEENFGEKDEATATIELDHYHIHYAPSDVYNEATLLRIVQP